MRRNLVLPALAGGALLIALALVLPADPVRAEEGATPVYLGPKSCKKCHFKQHKAWKKTKLAKAFEVLKPGEAEESKEDAGLDVDADYTGDAKCLKCHTTGYGTESGYPAVEEGASFTEEEQARADMLGGVTCEACHGSGSLYSKYKKDHEDYKRPDIVALGALAPVTEKNCAGCHVKECPTMGEDYAFDFEERKDSDELHAHVELKHEH